MRPGFIIAYALAASSLALGAIFLGKVGADVVLVGLGWPHVLLGFIFYFQRVIRDRGAALSDFLALLAVTVAIGVVHTLIPITGLIYVYFMFHAFRDEIFIYRQHQSGFRASGPIFDRAGRALLITTAIVCLCGRFKFQDRFISVELAAGATGLILVLALCAILRFPRGIFRKFPGLRYALPAYFLVFAVMVALKAARYYQFPAPLFNSFLVVFHYFSWYVFYIEKIQNRPAPAPSLAPAATFSPLGRLLRVMSTTRGFLAVVFVMNVVSFGLALASRSQGTSSAVGATGAMAFLGYAFSLKYFLYVLVFHVTISFAPKSAPRNDAPQIAIPTAAGEQVA